MTSWTINKHTAKRRPDTGMRSVAYVAGLSLSPTNIFGGALGRRDTRFEDSRYIRF